MPRNYRFKRKLLIYEILKKIYIRTYRTYVVYRPLNFVLRLGALVLEIEDFMMIMKEKKVSVITEDSI